MNWLIRPLARRQQLSSTGDATIDATNKSSSRCRRPTMKHFSSSPFMLDLVINNRQRHPHIANNRSHPDHLFRSGKLNDSRSGGHFSDSSWTSPKPESTKSINLATGGMKITPSTSYTAGNDHSASAPTKRWCSLTVSSSVSDAEKEASTQTIGGRHDREPYQAR